MKFMLTHNPFSDVFGYRQKTQIDINKTISFHDMTSDENLTKEIDDDEEVEEIEDVEEDEGEDSEGNSMEESEETNEGEV